jgi:hypothetical protein
MHNKIIENKLSESVEGSFHVTPDYPKKNMLSMG